MLKRFKDKKKNNKGFTLVELVVVVAILAILVGLLAPQYTKYVEKARKSADASNLENMVRAVEVALAETDPDKRIGKGTYTITINQKDVVNVTGGDATNVVNAIKYTVGDKWQATKLKSSSWAKTSISATITVDEFGAFSVTYDPEELKSEIDKS